jgi:acyl-coenzyme A thioesterase PaaI-like protein
MNYDPAADGWRPLLRAGLPGGLGVPWGRKQDGAWRYGLTTVEDHANVNGVLHGGVLMTFADHGLSMLAWEAAERAPCTTIQLNTQFLDAVHPGEFLELRGEVVRRTRGLVFLRGIISARALSGVRDIGAVDGIWRVLRPRT